jgi:quercetin dioxygenase-like cupin family protein
VIELPRTGPVARADRPATQLLHDEENVRIVGFTLGEGQEVAPHRSASTVVVQVLEGEGEFFGEGSEVRLAPGGTIVYAPDEMHSMRAVGGPLRFLALITPRPR